MKKYRFKSEEALERLVQSIYPMPDGGADLPSMFISIKDRRRALASELARDATKGVTLYHHGPGYSVSGANEIYDFEDLLEEITELKWFKVTMEVSEIGDTDYGCGPKFVYHRVRAHTVKEAERIVLEHHKGARVQISEIRGPKGEQ